MPTPTPQIASDPTIRQLSAVMLANARTLPDGRRMAPSRGTAEYRAYMQAQEALWHYTEQHWQQLGLPGNRWTLNPLSGDLVEHESAKKTALKIGVTTAGMVAGGYGLGAALAPTAAPTSSSLAALTNAPSLGVAAPNVIEGAGITGVTGGGIKALASRVPWLDVARIAVPTISNYFGTRAAARASDRASEIEAQAARDGLAEIRRQYDTDRADFEPYRTAGANSLARMTGSLDTAQAPALPQSVQRRLTGPGDTYTPASPLARMTGSQMPQDGSSPAPPQLRAPQPGVSTGMPVPEGDVVTLRTPGGQTFQVPAAQAQSFEARGAMRLS